MKITTVGIDLAKSVFQIHGVDERGKAAVKKQLKRGQVCEFFVNLPPCLIGMEACGNAHHWARKLESFGHTVRLMARQFVKLGWPTKTSGLSGRCWPTTGSSGPTTRPLSQSRSQIGCRNSTQQRQEIRTTDCSSNHEVMARQVRPWSENPALTGAPRVRVSDRGADQKIPSGTAAKSRNQSPDVRVQSLPSGRHELRAWHRGRPCTVNRPRPLRWAAVQVLSPAMRQGSKAS